MYGLGLIGEESITGFKTYHYDYRGSTVAITDAASTVTDTFTYDTYGKLTSRTGTTNTPFMYNGRDGVMTDENGLYYMRARYYHPEMNHLVKIGVALAVVAAIYLPQALVSLAPTAAEFVNQLTTLTPSFAQWLLKFMEINYEKNQFLYFSYYNNDGVVFL